MLVLLPVRDNTASQVVFFIFFVLPPERHKVKQGAKAFQQRVKNQLFLLLLDRQLCKAAPWEPRMKYKDLKIVEMLIFFNSVCSMSICGPHNGGNSKAGAQ